MSYIPQLISSFQNENVTFQCHSGFSYDLIHDLKKNDLDIVFCSYVDDQDIFFKPVVTQEFYVIVSLNHPLAKNDEIDLKQIEDLSFITFTKNSGIRPMIDHLLEKSKIHPHISMELEEDEVVGGFVGHDLGVAIVPDMAVYDLLPIKKIKIKDEYITLGQFLKFAGCVSSGIDAKMVIKDGLVLVNDETELRRGKKLRAGDRINFDGEEFIID